MEAHGYRNCCWAPTTNTTRDSLANCWNYKLFMHHPSFVRSLTAIKLYKLWPHSIGIKKGVQRTKRVINQSKPVHELLLQINIYIYIFKSEREYINLIIKKNSLARGFILFIYIYFVR